MRRYQKIIVSILFLIITLIQLSVFYYLGGKKMISFCDEMWTFNLSNSEIPGLYDNDEYTHRWLDPPFWSKMLSPSKDSAFKYKKTFDNQILDDAHPPLFYVVFHTICSFFPDTYSPWLAIGYNMFLFCFIQILIYLMSLDLTKNRYLSLLSVLMSGFSLGTVATIMYVRMYQMLTFFTTLAVFLTMLLIKNSLKDPSPFRLKKQYQLLTVIFLVYLMGALTHYHFLIFAFFLTGVSLLYFWITKEKSLAISYSLVTLGSVLCSFMIFPAAIKSISGRNTHGRGADALKNILHENIFSKIKGYTEIARDDLYLYYILGAIGLYFILLLLKKLFVLCTKNKHLLFKLKFKDMVARLIKPLGIHYPIKFKLKSSYIHIWILVFSSILSFLVLIQTTPWFAFRYIALYYPIFFILLALCFRKKLLTVFLIASFTFAAGKNFRPHNVRHLIYKQTPSIFLTKNHPDVIIYQKQETWWPAIYFIGYAQNIERGYIATSLDEKIEVRSSQVICIFSKTYYNDKMGMEPDSLETVKSTLGFKQLRKIGQDYQGETYLFYN